MPSEIISSNLASKREGAPIAIVVNDDRTQLALLSSILMGEGFETKIHTSPDSALAALKDCRAPALIVTDLHMPGMDGWRFCRLLRTPEYEAFNKTPVLVVSATYSGMDVDEVTKEAGANAFLPMPMNASEFKDTIGRLTRGEIPVQKATVLIVDDEKSFTDVLERLYAKNGYHAISAGSKAEALEAVRSNNPAVVILDHHLPDGKGAELMEEFQKISPGTAIIMMTADPNPALAADWLRRGARAYLPKPFDHAYLMALTHKAYREISLVRIESILDLRTLELRASEQKFRMLADFSCDWEYWADIDRNMLYCSSGCERISGYSPVEFVNDHELIERIVHPGDKMMFIKHREQVENKEAQDELVEIDFRIVNKDCGLRWVSHLCRPIFDSKGAYLGRRVSNRDITARK